MKPLIALMMAAVLATAAFGTAQVPDKLILDGEEVELLGAPLEMVWPDRAARPDFRTIGQPQGRILMSSANWRGYVATWRLDGERLMLVKIEKELLTQLPQSEGTALQDRRSETEIREVPIEKVLPGKTLPVFAEWYSGRLRVVRGETISFGTDTHGTVFGWELLLEIKSGVAVARAEVNNTGRNLYRSSADLEWCAFHKASGDNGGWIDARLLGTGRCRTFIESREEFRTRGVLFYQVDDRAALVALETPKTPEVDFQIQQLPGAPVVPGGSHVEVAGRLVRGEDSTELQVSAIRLLQPGESMHAASFPEEWDKLQAEQAAEKAAEAKKESEPVKAE